MALIKKKLSPPGSTDIICLQTSADQVLLDDGVTTLNTSITQLNESLSGITETAELTLLNGWVNAYPAVHAFAVKSGNEVSIDLRIKSGTMAQNTIISNTPTGMIPKYYAYCPAVDVATKTIVGVIGVTLTGTIVCDSELTSNSDIIANFAYTI